jgi:hypothetical protein
METKILSINLRQLYEDLGLQAGPVLGSDDPRLGQKIDHTTLEGALLFQDKVGNNLTSAISFLVEFGWLSEEKGRYTVTYKGLEKLGGDYSN